MTKAFDIKIKCEAGNCTLDTATILPLKDEFVEQVKTLEMIIGDTKEITITFREDKQ